MRAAKARSLVLGKARKLGNETNASAARSRAADIVPVIAELQAAGAESLRAIAAGLNARGIPTARGKADSFCSV